MKKIMFNDKYGLTEAVLRGDKTMTRRIIPIDLYNQTDWKAVAEGDFEAVVDGEGDYHDIRCCGTYKVGEEVAVAQCYEDAILDVGEEEWNHIHPWNCVANLCARAGLHNKMFVRADLMPHRIRITDIRVQRLKKISSEECIKEGIEGRQVGCHYFYFIQGVEKPYLFPKQAFAALIDKVSGKGTWERNPWVFAYEFELIK